MPGVNLGQCADVPGKGDAQPNGYAVYFVVGNADELYEFQTRQRASRSCSSRETRE